AGGCLGRRRVPVVLSHQEPRRLRRRGHDPDRPRARGRAGTPAAESWIVAQVRARRARLLEPAGRAPGRPPPREAPAARGLEPVAPSDRPALSRPSPRGAVDLPGVAPAPAPRPP